MARWDLVQVRRKPAYIPEQGSGKITQNPGEKLGWWQEAEVTEIAEKKVGKPSKLLPNLRNETREKA